MPGVYNKTSEIHAAFPNPSPKIRSDVWCKFMNFFNRS